MDDFTTMRDAGRIATSDSIQTPYTESQIRRYNAIEGAMKDSTDFGLLWSALEEYRLASLLLASVQPLEEHGVMHHLASIIEHNARLCVEAAVDLHTSLVVFAAQKALLALEREEA